MDNNPAPGEHEMPAAPPLRPEAFQARAAFADALDRLTRLTEAETVAVLSDGVLDGVFRAIAPLQAEDRREGELVYDYLLRHKTGLALIARVRRAVNNAYSIEGLVEGRRVYVSPDDNQWFDDGVMFLQGEERFGGFLGLYRDGQLSFAVSARDAVKGQALGPDDFVFIEIEEYRRLAAERFRDRPTEIDTALAEIQELLDQNVTEEARYQAYLAAHPWVLGALYSAVQSHERLDDRNIPDFSGVRVRDGSRDILEIKSPSIALFRADGEFHANFNAAWNQCERYLDFTRREADYLFRQRGLRFENPHCYLIAGRDLTPTQIAAARGKEKNESSGNLSDV